MDQCQHPGCWYCTIGLQDVTIRGHTTKGTQGCSKLFPTSTCESTVISIKKVLADGTGQYIKRIKVMSRWDLLQNERWLNIWKSSMSPSKSTG